MSYPIPGAALDDRLAFVGTSGSGKTYNAGTGVERLLQARARVCIPDPLGVWWGLALQPSGKKPSSFRDREHLVIFGGPRGDMPLTEHAGALIGETVAGMKESCILDLSELGTKAAERRFMLAFLTALYKHKTKDPLHIIFDEADMWAPQRVLDKEGEANKLLGMMETVIRRGRVKGFIPWLITQRPAVLSWNVLSMADGVVTFKLTSSHDRDAIGNWVEGQAEKKQWNEMWADLPTLVRGEGFVWLPSHGVLKRTKFPEKATFDSSRTPKRGEKQVRAGALKPVNLEKLKERLATVESEVKQRDVPTLRKRVSELEAELEREKNKKPAAPAADPKAERKKIEEAEKRGFDQAKKKLAAAGDRAFEKAFANLSRAFLSHVDGLGAELKKAIAASERKLEWPSELVTYTPPAAAPTPAMTYPALAHSARQAPAPRSPSAPKPGAGDSEFNMTPAKQKILDAIAWVASLGNPSMPKDTIAFMADTTPNSSSYANNLGSLRTAGLIDYPAGGMLCLTESGNAAAAQPEAAPTHAAIMAKISTKIAPAQMRIVQAAVAAYPADISKEDLAAAAGTTATSSSFANNLGRLRTFGLITYPPGGGRVRADDRLFPERAAA